MKKKPDRQLWEAAGNGDFAGVKVAVKAGADVNAYIYNDCVLGKASKNIHKDTFAIIRHLVEKGANINADWWILGGVVENGNPDALEIIRYFVEQGANIKTEWRILANVAGSKNPNALAIVKYLVEEGADVNADCSILASAARSENPDALEIVEYLVERGAKVNVHSDILANAAYSRNPDALTMVKYLVEQGVDIHFRDGWSETALTKALGRDNGAIADYLLARDDFSLSDLIPQPDPPDMYKPLRKKAIVHVSKLIDSLGLPYARKIAEDIGKIMKNEYTTKEDVAALEPLVEKIRTKDWMNDARVTSNDFETEKMDSPNHTNFSR